MFYSQVILAKKGPLAKVWLAAHWGDKKLARPQIFATDIAQSVDNIVNPVAPLALRMSGHLLLGVVRIYSRKVKYVLHDCTEAMLKLQMAFHPSSSTGGEHDKELLNLDHRQQQQGAPTTNIPNFGDYDQVHVVEGFCLPLPEPEDWIVADDTQAHAQANGGSGDGEQYSTTGTTNSQAPFHAAGGRSSISSPETTFQPPPEEAWVPFDPDHEDDDDDDNDNNENPALNQSRVSDVEVARAAGDSFLSNEEVRTVLYNTILYSTSIQICSPIVATTSHSHTHSSSFVRMLTNSISSASPFLDSQQVHGHQFLTSRRPPCQCRRRGRLCCCAL